MTESAQHRPTLVMGGTGKTGVWTPTDQPNPGSPR